MTIPTLMSKYQKQTYVTGLKKGYSILMNAVKMLPLSEGCPAGDYDCSGFSFELLTKNMKVSKHCRGNSLECFGINYESYIYSANATPRNFAVLPDGMILTTLAGSDMIYLDINGLKGPNKYGRDIFIFTDRFRSYGAQYILLPEGSSAFKKLPFGTYFTWSKDICKTENVNKSETSTLGCTARVLEEGAMNY